jgi:hypothetical protein
MGAWEQVGVGGSLFAVVLLFVFVGIGVAMLRGKLPKGQGQQEVGTEMVDMAALGEVAEPRNETCFGCPPEGPDVALGLDSNRCEGGVCPR